MSGYGGKATLGIEVRSASGSCGSGPCGKTAGYPGATTAQSHPRSRNPLTDRAVTTDTPFT
jgi:hypothetical protein